MPSELTRNPEPRAMGSSLFAMTIVTMDPFAALAIDGMSFRSGADCPAARTDMNPINRSTVKHFVFIITPAYAELANGYSGLFSISTCAFVLNPQPHRAIRNPRT